jgi:hypothetical protein
VTKKEQPLIIFAENIHLLAYKTGLHVNPGIKIWWYLLQVHKSCSTWDLYGLGAGTTILSPILILVIK